MANVSEILKKLRNDMSTDTGLLALLGKDSKVYRKYPQSSHRKPFIIFIVDNLNSQTQNTGVGEYRPDVTFDIIVIDPYDAADIFSYLEENWSIPLEKPEGVTSTNYRIDSLVFGNLIEVPGKLQEIDSGEAVTQFTAQASMRIIKVTP